MAAPYFCILPSDWPKRLYSSIQVKLYGLLICGCLVAGCVYGCDKGWIASTMDSCFKFVVSKMATWSQAQGLCRDMGGYLATLESIDELTWMRGFRGYHAQLRPDFAWIGGYLKNGVWTWKGEISDSPILYTDWGEKEPNNDDGNEGCLDLYGGNSVDGVTSKWNDESCKRKRFFICEKDK